MANPHIYVNPTVVDILVRQRTAEMDELMGIIDGTTPIEESEEISDDES